MSFPLEIMKPEQKISQMLASKWLSYQIVLDSSEWKQLFLMKELQSLSMYRSSGLFDYEKLEVSPENFLTLWDEYEKAIQSEKRVDDRLFRPYFSLFLTLVNDALIVQSASESRGMIHAIKPCVMMQLHRFSAISEPKTKILSGIFGPHTISWGVSLSYPQIVQDQKTKEVIYALHDERCRNRLLWRAIQKFCREKTVPTPLFVHSKKIWAPIRIGYSALDWIESNQELHLSESISIDQEALLKIPRPQ